MTEQDMEIQKLRRENERLRRRNRQLEEERKELGQIRQLDRAEELLMRRQIEYLMENRAL